MKETIFLICGLTDVQSVGNQSFKNTVKYLSEFGYRIHVFTSMPENYPGLQDPRSIFNSNVEFHRLPSLLIPIINLGKEVKDLIGRRRGKFRLQSKAIPNKTMGTYLKEYNPIGRIFYLVFLFLAYVPMELLRLLRYYFKYRPSLLYGVNCQGTVVASILGRLLKKPVITRYFGVCASESDVSNPLRRLFVLDEIAGLVSPTDAIIMANDGTKGDKVLKLLHVDEGKIHLWMNGFDADHLKLPDAWNADDFRRALGVEDKKIILMVSRLAPWKRVDRGVNCIYKLVKKYKMENLVLLVAGEGPERQSLEVLAKRLGIDGFVKFLGGVPHKELCRYFAISDIFLSLYDVSNMGNPIIEALHFSLPIITINDGSTAHLLENYTNTLLVDVKDIDDELPLKVKQLLNEESLRKTISHNAKITFKEKVLPWEKRMELEDRLIEDILYKARQA